MDQRRVVPLSCTHQRLLLLLPCETVNLTFATEQESPFTTFTSSSSVQQSQQQQQGHRTTTAEETPKQERLALS